MSILISRHVKLIKFDNYTYSNAVSSGNLDNMKWLKENGCKMDSYSDSDSDSDSEEDDY